STVTAVAGIEPASEAGAVNLDFEDGTLEGWTVEGEAFAGEAVRSAAGGAAPTGYEGSYWVSSGDTLTYESTGETASQPFLVTEPYASFRIAGGALKDTRVEVV